MNNQHPISFKAVTVAALVDIIGSSIAGAIVMAYAVYHYGLSSLPPAELSAELRNIMVIAPLYYVSFFFGASFSILSGYIAARIAKRAELLNGTLSSFLCVLSGLFSMIGGSSGHSLIVGLFFLALSPALGWCGGYLCLKFKDKQSQAQKS